MVSSSTVEHVGKRELMEQRSNHSGAKRDDDSLNKGESVLDDKYMD